MPTVPIPTPGTPDAPRALVAADFTRDDRADLAYTAYLLAQTLGEITRTDLRAPGDWDLSTDGPDVLARLHRALDRLTTAIGQTRTDLHIVEHRIRRRPSTTGGAA